MSDMVDMNFREQTNPLSLRMLSKLMPKLQQLGTAASEKGLVTVTAPISGTVSAREVTLGQTFEDAGGKLMTIVNDSRVFATANIYEKDLDKVKTGQRAITQGVAPRACCKMS
jgi:cobalt-zinc-cadmium efflux system membrane fusion protein